MNVAIKAGEIDAAAESFATANGVAAQFYNGLTEALGKYGAMAGDDKTSDEFAAQYDGAAREAVGGFADLVGALAGMARLVSLTATNHRSANASSVYSATPPAYDGDQYDALPDSTVTVASYTPPSSVGGDDPDTPELWDQITDYLEGWTWPGADTGRLREAAGTWRNIGTILTAQITPYLDTAQTKLEAQRSPEMADALGVIADLRLQIEQLGHHCKELGEACDGYAQQVDDVKDVVRGILRDLAIEVGVTVVVAGIASLFSFGAAAGGGAAIAGWRLASAARKVIQAFSAMKAVVKAASVARLAKVAGKIPVLRRRFTRISEAANRARHEQFKDALRAAMGKPHTKDPSLTKIMDKTYRENAQVGSGSTAAAVRHELATGQPVGGAWHSQKARDTIIELQRWLKNHPDATPGDRAAAENVIRDLQNALDGN